MSPPTSRPGRRQPSRPQPRCSGRSGLARPGWAPTSILDLGAGPGIAAWAAVRGLARDRDGHARRGRARDGARRQGLAAPRADGAAAGAHGRWPTSDAPPAHADLVLVSYVIGELEPAALAAASLDTPGRLPTDTLAIVEPGTTAGYERVLAVRDAVHRRRRLDARTLPPRRTLPPPRGRLVPLRDPARPQPNAPAREGRRARIRGREVRLRRPHALAAPQRPAARVLRRPDLRPGHVVLDLCTAGRPRAPHGLEARRRRTTARPARSRWGDTL